jgi:hypothetical protein
MMRLELCGLGLGVSGARLGERGAAFVTQPVAAQPEHAQCARTVQRMRDRAGPDAWLGLGFGFGLGLGWGWVGVGLGLG